MSPIFRLACVVFVCLAFCRDGFALSLFNSGRSYNIDLDGPDSLLTQLQEELDRQRNSNLYLQQLSTPNRVARYESQILLERLKAEGYYDATVNFELAEDQISYRVNAGSVYRIAEIVLQLPEGIEIPAEALGIQSGNRLRAERVLAAESALRNYVSANYCLFEIDVDYNVVAELETHNAVVTFSVEDSPSVVFGEVSLTGLQTVDSDYLSSLLPMKQGDCFKRALVDNARLKLVQSNLLTAVTADVGSPDNGKIAVQLKLTERFHRTLSAGAGFQSDNGFGVSAGWEHRNLLGRAEQLQLDANIAERFQSLSSEFRIPQFLRSDQTIVFYTDLTGENSDAYDSKSAEAGAEVTRRIGNHLSATLGGDLTFSRVKEDGETDDFALLSAPVGLEYDRRNDPLDPTKGWVAAAQFRPYWDGYDSSTRFIKTALAGSAYYTLDEQSLRPTFAVRGATGLINGEDRDTIPANIRFYSGGGGSVRGYPFQTLGPLDEEDDPSGGLSYTEISFESRLRFGQSWGAVLFLDGGYAYEDRTPSLDENLLWGAGVGVRYYTSFAPIRFDVAVPLDKRDDIDDSFQIYISIGQSF